MQMAASMGKGSQVRAVRGLKPGHLAADRRSAMVDKRSSGGLVVSALCAAVLAVAVFSPWYSIGITSAGAAAAQQQLATVAQQYGNASLQSMADEVGSQFSSVAGRQLATVSAHQALKDLSRLLLLLAAVALVTSVLALAGVVEVGGGQIACVGIVAAVCVLYRMLAPPGTDTGLVSLSLGWGSWLALFAAAGIVVGGLWGSFADQSKTPRYDSLPDSTL